MVPRAEAAHPQRATERRARSNRTTCPTHGRVPARYAERGRSARARWNTGTKMVRIHGDIFVTRCSRCDFSDAGRGGSPEPPGASAVEPRIAATSEKNQDVPRCPECHALMRPGVVWFGEQLPRNELQRVENFLDGGACDVVIVAGTTATFGYIIDWALRGSRDGAELIEVNPEETPLSRFATRLVREPAAIALPRIVDEVLLDASVVGQPHRLPNQCSVWQACRLRFH